MEGPAFLTDELRYTVSIDSDEKLVSELKKRPTDLVDYFELGCADETWAENHLQLLGNMLRVATKAFYLSQFPHYLADRMMKVLQAHYSVLHPLLYFRPALFFNMNISIKDQNFLVSSLFFGASSAYFWELFKQRFYNCHDELIITTVTPELFKLLIEHVNKGVIADLWRHSKDDVLTLMKQARQWGLHKLVKECAHVVKRYINHENVIETMLQAHKQLFTKWKQDCFDVFNQQSWGLKCLPGRDTDLRIEVLNDNQETLDLLHQLAPWITHLTLGGTIGESPYFENMIDQCPKLIGIDLSGSIEYVDQFDYIPDHINELNLSNCSWLNSEYLAIASIEFPRLKTLILQSSSHLNYMSWGVLNNFKNLTTLNISYNQELIDEDLKLIVQSCPHLNELILEECHKITNRGIQEVVQNSKQLSALNISRCYNLTDKTLHELTKIPQLRDLEIVRCVEFTDQALIHFLNLSHSLKSINIQQCNFSPFVIEKIKKNFPLLEIIF